MFIRSSPHDANDSAIPDLIKEICTDVDFERYDLMALRLTCKITCELSTQSFDLMCFTGISILLTRRSLEALIAISKHPRIGPQIQRVTLTPLRTFSEVFSSLIPALLHQYLDRYHEEVELEQSGDALGLLTEAFKTLRKYDRSLCLEISDDEQTYVGARGCFSGAVVEVREESNVFKLYWKEATSLLIKAVTNSGCTIARLSLSNVTDADLVGGGQLWDDDLDEDIDRLSANLTAFDVDIHRHRSDAVLKSVKQVLLQAKDLNILTLQGAGANMCHDLAQLSDAVVSDSLKVINLSNLYCSELDLVSFLSKHRSTLGHLWLSSTRLVGSWRSLVLWIRSNLKSLRTFGMYDTFDGDLYSPTSREQVPPCEFFEMEDMSIVLEELLGKGIAPQS
ncbi:hypothetical protein M436DRAFT_68302 [Aureobasidium namibiae CBS 147.97]|uniref:Uncharacterized protein n=1 Tax=Aureobasidium namibiae CBS 147.97 TaxID=1043004 RepID=A0A074X0T1_9PEZI|nr:uncharacterized protein M436DRAFT_68302 [Aureobasidium namibiae CBS 147.97]KEQ68236.1 hypothetical protein M436DRAFT_68302 [Aureobasidium namibiae CBS 147.97]